MVSTAGTEAGRGDETQRKTSQRGSFEIPCASDCPRHLGWAVRWRLCSLPSPSRPGGWQLRGEQAAQGEGSTTPPRGHCPAKSSWRSNQGTLQRGLPQPCRLAPRNLPSSVPILCQRFSQRTLGGSKCPACQRPRFTALWPVPPAAATTHQFR